MAYDIATGCRVPACQSSVILVEGGLSTAVVLQQTITGDAASLTPWRVNALEELYSIRLGCRVPFCLAKLEYQIASITMRVMLVIPDAPPGSNAMTMASATATAAAVTAAAQAFAAQPAADLSAMMNETVVSTLPPMVSRVRRIDVQVVLSIPDSVANATVASIRAAANTLASRPTAVASLLNATLTSTSSFVVGHTVTPLGMAAPPSPLAIANTASTRPSLVAGIAIPTAVVIFALVAVAVARTFRKIKGLETKELVVAANERHSNYAQQAWDAPRPYPRSEKL